MNITTADIQEAVKPYTKTHVANFLRKVVAETKSNHKQLPFNDLVEMKEFLSIYIEENGKDHVKVVNPEPVVRKGNLIASETLNICSLCKRPIMGTPVIYYQESGTQRFTTHSRSENCSARKS